MAAGGTETSVDRSEVLPSPPEGHLEDEGRGAVPSEFTAEQASTSGQADTAANAHGEEEERLCYVCMDPLGGPLLDELPCACTGSVGAIHVECFRKDLSLNRRQECSVCHTKYTFEEKVYEYSMTYRLYLALKSNPVWLTLSTLSCLALAAIAILLLDDRNSVFRVDNVLFSQDVGMLGGGSAACLLFVVWRYTLMTQPVAEIRRTLMSLPNEMGEQKVLLEFTIKSPPQRRAPQPRPADGAALGRVSFWEEMTGYAAHSHSRDSGASPGGSPADRAPADAEALADVRVDTGPAEDGAGAAEGARDGEGAEGAARAGAGSGAGMARDASGRRGVRPSAAREEWSVRRRGDFPL